MPSEAAKKLAQAIIEQPEWNAAVQLADTALAAAREEGRQEERERHGMCDQIMERLHVERDAARARLATAEGIVAQVASQPCETFLRSEPRLTCADAHAVMRCRSCAARAFLSPEPPDAAE